MRSQEFGKEDKNDLTSKLAKIKTKRKQGLHSDSVRFSGEDNQRSSLIESDFLLKLFTHVPKEGACHNFAYYSELILLYWRPKRVAWHHAPLNTPLIRPMIDDCECS